MCLCAVHLALVEVIDNLLVELVLQLALGGGLVAVALGQVGGARLVRPLGGVGVGTQHCFIIKASEWWPCSTPSNTGTNAIHFAAAAAAY